MSLIDRATELEYYPEQQLIQMSQDPQGQYPQFLVLSEIQRRNNMRRMYQNEVNKMNQPSTTVAEEAVMEFAGQGAVPMMDASSSLSSTSEGGLRSMAPIPMRSGKKTKIEKDEQELSEELREILAKDRRYEKQYRDYETREKLLYPLVPRDYIVSDDEYNRLRRQGKYMREGDLQDYRPIFALMGALSGEDAPRYMPESKVKGLKAMLEATRKEKQMQQMGFQSGGSTALEQSFVSPMRNPMGATSPAAFSSLVGNTQDAFSSAINWAKENPMDALNLAANATFFLPGVGLLAGATIKGGTKLLPYITRAAKAAFTKKQAPMDVSRVNVKQPLGEAAKSLGLGAARTKVPQGRRFSPSRTAIFGLPALGTAYNLTMAGLGGFGGDDTKSDADQLSAQEVRAEQANKKLQDLISEIGNQSKDTTSRGRSFGLDGLTLAQLGGIIGTATTPGEVAGGIGALATQMQQAQREGRVEGAQMRLLEAQTAKYLADVANMDLDNALAQYQQLDDLVDSNVLTPEEAKIREAILIQRINQLQGIDTDQNQKSYSQFVSG